MATVGNNLSKKVAGSKGPIGRRPDDEDEGPFKAKKSMAWENIPNKATILSYLLWYFNSTSRCKHHPDRSTTSVEIHRVLKEQGLVLLSFAEDEDERDVDVHTITEKGCALVRHIMGLPLPEPVTTWSMPEKES